MSRINCVSQIDKDTGDIVTTLRMPAEVLDRINNAEDQLGEQEGAVMRDKLLQALAAMVIASVDGFRSDFGYSIGAQERKIRADHERIKAQGGPPQIGLGDEPLQFGSRVQ